MTFTYFFRLFHISLLNTKTGTWKMWQQYYIFSLGKKLLQFHIKINLNKELETIHLQVISSFERWQVPLFWHPHRTERLKRWNLKSSRRYFQILTNSQDILQFQFLCLMAYQPSWIISYRGTVMILLTNNWGGARMGFIPFPKSICQKVSTMARLEFELAYFEAAA